jgi:hypothetical protein
LPQKEEKRGKNETPKERKRKSPDFFILHFFFFLSKQRKKKTKPLQGFRGRGAEPHSAKRKKKDLLKKQ